MANTITGTSGADTIVGTTGDDIIIGGGGADTLTGNGGVNVYQYNAFSDSSFYAPDKITDFVSGVDEIDISRLGSVKISITENGTSFGGVRSSVLISGSDSCFLDISGVVSLSDFIITNFAGGSIQAYDSLNHLTGSSTYGANGSIATQLIYATTISSAGLYQTNLTENITYDSSGRKKVDITYGTTAKINYYSSGILTETDAYITSNTTDLLSKSYFDQYGKTTADYFDSAGRIFFVQNRQDGGWTTNSYLSDDGTLTKQVGLSATGDLLYTLESDAVTVPSGSRSTQIIGGGNHWTSTPESTGVSLTEGLTGSTTFDFAPQYAPIGEQYDIINGFHPGTDKIDLSRLAFGDVVVDDHGNGWTSVFFASNGLGNIAVHGAVTAGDLFVGSGANVSFIKDH